MRQTHRRRFQSPDEDSFAPKHQCDQQVAARVSRFSPLTRIRSPQSGTHRAMWATADEWTFQSPDEDSFAPKQQVAARGSYTVCSFSPLTRIRSPQSAG